MQAKITTPLPLQQPTKYTLRPTDASRQSGALPRHRRVGTRRVTAGAGLFVVVFPGQPRSAATGCSGGHLEEYLFTSKQRGSIADLRPELR